MKAILINPKLQTINHVDYSGDYKDIQKSFKNFQCK